MTVKRIKPSASQRTVKRLQEQIDALGNAKALMRRQLQDYQVQCDQLVGAAQQRNQYLSDILVNNNVKITELENQVANQYKENAELRQDMSNLHHKYNKNVQTYLAIKERTQALETNLTAVYLELDEAQTKISYRVYRWSVAVAKRIREVFAIRIKIYLGRA
jgi:arginine deiminase